MDLRRHPDLADKLATKYAVGTLRTGTRRRFEQISHHDDAVHATVERRQHYLADLPALQPATVPLPEIPYRVRVQLGWHELTSARRAFQQWIWRGTSSWRSVTAVAAVVAAVAIGLNLRLAQQLYDAPVANVVAVLQDAQVQTAVLVTWGARTGTLPPERLDATPLSIERALRFWTLPPDGHPQSLRVIGHQHAMRLTVAQPLRQVPTLTIGVEPRGDSPNPQGPIGPAVSKGALISSMLQTPRRGGREACRVI